MKFLILPTRLLRFLTQILAACFAIGGLSCSFAFATGVPQPLVNAGITEHLGDSVLINDLSFRDETGKAVALSSYFNQGRPVVMVMAYYGCPNLCTFVLNGLVESLKGLSWVPGNQFEVITVSIDPTETPELAAKKKKAYLTSLAKPEAAAGWHFLTGAEPQIRKLANAIGFGYQWDAEEKQFAHSAAIYTLTPDGRISRYLYGIEFRSSDLKLSLLEASNGKIGTVIERFLLFCYRYDPKTRKYSVYLTKVMQVATAATIALVGSYLGVFWYRQRRTTQVSMKTSKKEEPNTDV